MGDETARKRGPLEKRIVEAFAQLGISVRWEAS